MTEKTADPQDPIIRIVLIAAPVLAVLGFLATVLIVTAMISVNFNFMNWLE